MNDEKTFAHKLYGAVRIDQNTEENSGTYPGIGEIKEEEKREITQTETIKE